MSVIEHVLPPESTCSNQRRVHRVARPPESGRQRGPIGSREASSPANPTRMWASEPRLARSRLRLDHAAVLTQGRESLPQTSCVQLPGLTLGGRGRPKPFHTWSDFAQSYHAKIARVSGSYGRFVKISKLGCRVRTVSFASSGESGSGKCRQRQLECRSMGASRLHIHITAVITHDFVNNGQA